MLRLIFNAQLIILPLSFINQLILYSRIHGSHVNIVHKTALYDKTHPTWVKNYSSESYYWLYVTLKLCTVT